MKLGQVKTVKPFLDCLVALNKSIIPDIGRDRGYYGVTGILLADKQGVVCGCHLFNGSICPPAPQVTQHNLTLGIFRGLKAGFIPVGIVVLNPDDGSYCGYYTPKQKQNKKIYIGGTTKEAVRMYTYTHMYAFLKDFSSPLLMLIDDELVPLQGVIRKTSSGRQRLGFRKVLPIPVQENTPVLNFFTDRGGVCYDEKLKAAVEKLAKEYPGEVRLNGEVFSRQELDVCVA